MRGGLHAFLWPDFLREIEMTHRQITNDDLWAAIRGIGMNGMTYRQLEELRHEHAHPDKPFASQVIAETARQMMAVKRRFQFTA